MPFGGAYATPRLVPEGIALIHVGSSPYGDGLAVRPFDV
jgi:hypothetical protein